MKKFNKERAGVEKQYTLRTVGSILHELVNTSNEPLYEGYRAYLATKEKAKDGGQEDE